MMFIFLLPHVRGYAEVIETLVDINGQLRQLTQEISDGKYNDALKRAPNHDQPKETIGRFMLDALDGLDPNLDTLTYLQQLNISFKGINHFIDEKVYRFDEIMDEFLKALDRKDDQKTDALLQVQKKFKVRAELGDLIAYYVLCWMKRQRMGKWDDDESYTEIKNFPKSEEGKDLFNSLDFYVDPFDNRLHKKIQGQGKKFGIAFTLNGLAVMKAKNTREGISPIERKLLDRAFLASYNDILIYRNLILGAEGGEPFSIKIFIEFYNDNWHKISSFIRQGKEEATLEFLKQSKSRLNYIINDNNRQDFKDPFYYNYCALHAIVNPSLEFLMIQGYLKGYREKIHEKEIEIESLDSQILDIKRKMRKEKKGSKELRDLGADLLAKEEKKQTAQEALDSLKKELKDKKDEQDRWLKFAKTLDTGVWDIMLQSLLDGSANFDILLFLLGVTDEEELKCLYLEIYMINKETKFIPSQTYMNEAETIESLEDIILNKIRNQVARSNLRLGLVERWLKIAQRKLLKSQEEEAEKIITALEPILKKLKGDEANKLRRAISQSKGDGRRDSPVSGVPGDTTPSPAGTSPAPEGGTDTRGAGSALQSAAPPPLEPGVGGSSASDDLPPVVAPPVRPQPLVPPGDDLGTGVEETPGSVSPGVSELTRSPSKTRTPTRNTTPRDRGEPGGKGEATSQGTSRAQTKAEREKERLKRNLDKLQKDIDALRSAGIGRNRDRDSILNAIARISEKDVGIVSGSGSRRRFGNFHYHNAHGPGRGDSFNGEALRAFLNYGSQTIEGLRSAINGDEMVQDGKKGTEHSVTAPGAAAARPRTGAEESGAVGSRVKSKKGRL